MPVCCNSTFGVRHCCWVGMGYLPKNMCGFVAGFGAQVLLAAGPQGLSIGDIIQRANDMGLTETYWDTTSSRKSSISSVHHPCSPLSVVLIPLNICLAVPTLLACPPVLTAAVLDASLKSLWLLNVVHIALCRC